MLDSSVNCKNEPLDIADKVRLSRLWSWDVKLDALILIRIRAPGIAVIQKAPNMIATVLTVFFHSQTGLKWCSGTFSTVWNCPITFCECFDVIKRIRLKDIMLVQPGGKEPKCKEHSHINFLGVHLARRACQVRCPEFSSRRKCGNQSYRQTESVHEDVAK